MERARRYQHSLMNLAVQRQDDQLIQLAGYLGQMIAPGPREAGTLAAGETSTLEKVKTPGFNDYLVDFETRLLISMEMYDSAWNLVKDAGIELQRLNPDLATFKLVTFLRAYIARGIELENISPLLIQGLAEVRKREERFTELQLLALAAWHQSKTGRVLAASLIFLNSVLLAVETGYMRVLLDIPDLVQLSREIGIPLDAERKELEQSIDVALEPNLLSNQELRVLELLAENLTYRQIAGELVVSLNTVRSHIRNLYAKLSVNQREEVLFMAGILGLLRKTGAASNDHSI